MTLIFSLQVKDKKRKANNDFVCIAEHSLYVLQNILCMYYRNFFVCITERSLHVLQNIL